MIDCENIIYTNIVNALTTKYGSGAINVTSVYQNAPASFPSVSIIQEDNVIAEDTVDSGGIENAVDILFEVNVYVNSKSNKKGLCKEIFGVVDGCFVELGFYRTYAKPIPNEDESIYRMLGRFTAKIDKNYNISRR